MKDKKNKMYFKSLLHLTLVIGTRHILPENKKIGKQCIPRVSLHWTLLTGYTPDISDNKKIS